MQLKKNMIRSIYHLAMAALLLSSSTVQADLSNTTVSVDWEKFLGNHDPVWGALPTRPLDGPMIGNGFIGTYLIQDETSGNIRFEISRNNLCDVRSNFRVRKTNGYFELVMAAGTPTGTCRLEVWNAQLTADLNAGSGGMKIRAFTAATNDVIVFELTPKVGGLGYTFDFVPDNQDLTPGTASPAPPAAYVAYPDQVRSTNQNCIVSVKDMPVDAIYYTQTEPAASQHATAWRVVEEAGKTYVFVSVVMSYRASTAMQEAIDNVNNAVAKGLAGVEADHRTWWHNYYQKSFVTLPAQLERFHWLQMYKLASMTRPDSITDLTGPWFDRDLVWNGVWFDWNTEKQYSNVFTANHPEYSDAVLNFLWDRKDTYYDSASDGYRVSWGAVSALSGLPAGTDAGCLAWLLNLSWERYQCTMDTNTLTKLVPLMKGAYNYMMYHNVFTGTDGALHIEAMGSPEYKDPDGNGQFEDTTFQLSNLRWLCNTIIAINTRYGGHAAAAAACQTTLDNLTPYNIDPAEGFMIGKDTRLETAHRHDSHELAIYPYYEYTPNDPVQAAVIQKTAAHHKAVGFQTYGMSEAVWGIMSAMQGNGDDALESIAEGYGYLINPTVSAYTTRNMCCGTGYTEEGPFVGDRVIQEMLLQSWGDGVIRVFPAVPSGTDWARVAFSDFRAKGAFLVTAKRVAGATRFVKIASLAGEPCKVKTDLIGTVKVSSDFGCTLTDLGDGVVQINNLNSDEWCILYTGDTLPDLTIEALYDEGDNLARNKPATQSSTLEGAAASYVVDGKVDGASAQTTNEAYAWWQVDLMDNIDVEKINIWTAGDPSAEYTLSILDAEGTDVWSKDLSGQNGSPIKVFIEGETAIGRYVKIQQNTTNNLSLAEVQVYGDTPNIAVNKMATQSTTVYGGLASHAVDGNTDGNFNNGSVTHTDYDVGAWWQVDLGADYTIDRIKVWNRVGNSDRLTDYTVGIRDRNGTSIWTHVEADQAGSPTTVNVGGIEGRSVFIQLNGTNNLTLAEVEVFGGLTPVEPLAYVVTTSASATAPSASNDDLAQTHYLSSSATGNWSLPTYHTGLFNGTVSDADGADQGTEPSQVWLSTDASFTVNLDVSVHTLGYDITSIRSIFGWNGGAGGRANQGYEITVTYMDEITETLVGPDHWEPNASGAYWTTVTFSNATSGVMVSGVKSITFSGIYPANAAAYGDFCVAREFDIFGEPTEDGTAHIPVFVPGLTVSNGNFMVGFSGTTGQHYRFEYTDDLMSSNSWQVVSDLVSLETSPMDVSAPMTNSARFYRMIWLP